MSQKQSLKPIKGANRSLRSRLSLQGEFVLALAPTVTVLVVLGLVEVLSSQRLLFGSLAGSASSSTLTLNMVQTLLERCSFPR